MHICRWMSLLQGCVTSSEDPENLTIQGEYVLDSTFSYSKEEIKGKRKNSYYDNKKEERFIIHQ